MTKTKGRSVVKTGSEVPLDMIETPNRRKHLTYLIILHDFSKRKEFLTCQIPDIQVEGTRQVGQLV